MFDMFDMSNKYYLLTYYLLTYLLKFWNPDYIRRRTL